MEQEELWRDYSALPADARRQVLDFIAFLRTRKGCAVPDEGSRMGNLTEDAFIGMWRDRDEMADSGIYVRRLRASEWKHD